MPSLFGYKYTDTYGVEDFECLYLSWLPERQRAFWWLAGEPEGGFKNEPFAVEFRVSEEYALTIGYGSDRTFQELFLNSAACPDLIQLGWLDCAHWHPHVLRSEELEQIWRCVVRRSGALTRPALPLLMLHEFTARQFEETPERLCRILRKAWRGLGLFTEREIVKGEPCGLKERSEVFREIQEAHPGVWEQDAERDWVLTGDEGSCVYSLRTAENNEFLFQALNEMLEQAQECGAK